MVIGELIFVLKISFLLWCISCNMCVSEVVRALTITSIYRIKNPNITKNWENHITAASQNEQNTEADEQWLLMFEEQLFILKVLINPFFSLFHSVFRAKNNEGEVATAASNCLMMVRVAVKMEAQNEK